MVNFDAAYKEEARTGGWGCLAQNADGEIMFAAAGDLSDVLAEEPFRRRIHDKGGSKLEL